MEYTEKVERFSIDECFLDLTEYLKPGEDLIKIGIEIKERVKKEFGFTVNVGVSDDKILAKIASDFEKPDKIHTLYENEISTKMWPLPVSELFMVGKRSIPKLEKMGIKTIGDLARTDEKVLIRKFGKFGKMIWEYANGIDTEPVEAERGKPKGIGNSVTLPHDEANIEKLEEVLLALVEQVSYRLRRQQVLANVVNVQIKTSEFKVFSHQRKLSEPTDSTKYIYNEAKKLFTELYNLSANKQIRLLGVRVDNLVETEEMQLSIFKLQQTNSETDKQEKIDDVMDALKNKYGYNTITRAGKMNVEKFIRIKE